MDELMEILEDQRPDIDFTAEDQLVDDHILESLDIISIVYAISEEFDIEIKPSELIPANFNSAEAMWNLVQRLQEDA